MKRLTVPCSGGCGSLWMFLTTMEQVLHEKRMYNDEDEGIYVYVLMAYDIILYENDET